MMVRPHQMRQAERGHIVDHRLPTSQHHRHDGFQESGIAAERLRRPFARDLRARQPRIPREPAKGVPAGLRSEEHTSELQSLMRISYAVLCLKKKTELNNDTQQDNNHITYD